MTPEIALAFILGLIGGFITTVLIIYGLVSKLIRVGIMKKSDTDSFFGDGK